MIAQSEVLQDRRRRENEARQPPRTGGRTKPRSAFRALHDSLTQRATTRRGR